MTPKDARSLNAPAQEHLRRRAVAAVRAGSSQADVARTLGVAAATVCRWMRKAREGTVRALAAQRRGRPPLPARLSPIPCAQTVNAITDRCPDQLKLPFALWTREAVGAFIAQRFGVALSVATVGRYLRRWNLTPQRPARRALEQDPAAVRRWLKEEYPAIAAAARAEGAEILWGDEMGVRSDHQTGTTYGRRGQTPVVERTGQRFTVNMVCAVSNRGTLRFKLFRGRFDAAVMIDFLARLVTFEPGRRKVLVLDNLAVHRSAAVRTWADDHRAQIRLVFLPPYAPELNPDELLNNDVKRNARNGRCAADADDLEEDLAGYLRATQDRPDIVRKYFAHPSVRYAAEC